jgi:hypothetical protein
MVYRWFKKQGVHKIQMKKRHHKWMRENPPKSSEMLFGHAPHRHKESFCAKEDEKRATNCRTAI